MILQYHFTLSISFFFCECLLIEDKKLSERSKFGSKFNWHRLQLHFMIFFLLLGGRKEQRKRMCEREMLEFGNDDDFSLLKRQSYYMRQPQILIFSCSVLCVRSHKPCSWFNFSRREDELISPSEMHWSNKNRRSNERVWKLSVESKWFLKIIIVKYFYQARTFFIHHPSFLHMICTI